MQTNSSANDDFKKLLNSQLMQEKCALQNKHVRMRVYDEPLRRYCYLCLHLECEYKH